jgi:hypothetical protein
VFELRIRNVEQPSGRIRFHFNLTFLQPSGLRVFGLYAMPTCVRAFRPRWQASKYGLIYCLKVIRTIRVGLHLDGAGVRAFSITLPSHLSIEVSISPRFRPQEALPICLALQEFEFPRNAFAQRTIGPFPIAADFCLYNTMCPDDWRQRWAFQKTCRSSFFAASDESVILLNPFICIFPFKRLPRSLMFAL